MWLCLFLQYNSFEFFFYCAPSLSKIFIFLSFLQTQVCTHSTMRYISDPKHKPDLRISPIFVSITKKKTLKMVAHDCNPLRKEESKLKARLAYTAKLYLKTNRGWRGGSVVKITCSCGRPRFGPQHPHGDSQPCINSSSRGHPLLQKHQHTQYTLHPCRQTHIQNKS